MRVLIDTNVVLDLLLDREPYADAAVQLFSLVDAGRIDGSMCSTTVTTIHYIAARTVGVPAANRHLREMLAMLDVAAVDGPVLESALTLEFEDFEDAVLHEAAVASGASAIVTRNGKDFARAVLPVFDPQELIAAVLASSE